MKLSNVIPYLIIFVFGVIGGYLLIPTKIITKTVSSEEDKQTIAKLSEQLKKQTRTRTVITFINGDKNTETTETEIIENKSIDSETSTKESKSVEEYEKVQINPKSFTIEGGLLTDKSIYGHVNYKFMGPIGIGVIGSTQFQGVGISISF